MWDAEINTATRLNAFMDAVFQAQADGILKNKEAMEIWAEQISQKIYSLSDTPKLTRPPFKYKKLVAI